MSESKPDTITLRTFEIDKLHRDRDVKVRFFGKAKILVDENGAGKTTILRCMYYLFEGAWSKLLTIDFDALRVSFSDGVSVCITRGEIEKKEQMLSPGMQDLIRVFGTERIRQISHLARETSFVIFRQRRSVIEILENSPYSARMLYEILVQSRPDRDMTLFDTKETATSELDQKVKDILTRFPYKVIYLPTYRRVEQSFIIRDEPDNKRFADPLMQFGMTDVDEQISEITNEIRDAALDAYSRMSGLWLTHLLEQQKDPSDLPKFEKRELQIILDRIGDTISQTNKENIYSLLESNQINQSKYEGLSRFIGSLITAYRAQKENDEAIRSFKEIANGYLSDKEFIYDESKVKLYLRLKRSQKQIDLQYMSSGEKQLVSLFSRLYLSRIGKCALLFDEPELSLSMEWQQKFLPDVMRSGKCCFLLAATHSPFIYENEFDHAAGVIESTYGDASNGTN